MDQQILKISAKQLLLILFGVILEKVRGLLKRTPYI